MSGHAGSQNFAFSSSVIKDGLVLYLDATSSLVSSSYGYDGINWNSIAGGSGTLISSPTYTITGAGSGSFNFNGSTTYITTVLPTNAITNISIASWVYVILNTHGTILKTGNNFGGYSFGIGASNADNNGNNILGLFDNIRWLDTGVAYNAGWNFITMTLNSSGTPTIYKNGTLVGSYSGTNAIAPANLFVIGRDLGGDTGRFFTGSVASVQMYNRALSIGEIVSIYSGSKARFGL